MDSAPLHHLCRDETPHRRSSPAANVACWPIPLKKAAVATQRYRSDLFRRVFESVLRRCIEERLVGGEG
ncbi:hypothetical protein, partial [Bradyrhizobium sp. UFLA05-112]